MRSIAGPNRTRRPRNAKGSIRNGWIRSSGAVVVRVLKSKRSGVIPGKKPQLDSHSGSGRSPPDGQPLSQAPGKNALLGMQPVLRFIPDNRLRAVDDPGGDLLAAFCRQPMHEDRVRLGLRPQLLVD